MATDRIVGIDLGTTNSLVAYMEGDRPVVIPGEDGSNLVPSVVALDRRRADRRRQCRAQIPDRDVRARGLQREAPDGPRRRRHSGRAEALPFPPGRRLAAGRGAAHQARREDLHAAGNFGVHSAPAEAQRRAILRRAGDQGGHHRARVLQRRAAAGDERCRPHRRPRSAAPGERADGGVARLRARQDRTRRRSPSTTSAAARSTSRSSSCTTASSR